MEKTSTPVQEAAARRRALCEREAARWRAAREVVSCLRCQYQVIPAEWGGGEGRE
jgi:hypothetical protein